MSKQMKSEKQALVPRLRFPEFRDTEEWTTAKLGSLTEISTEKVGEKTCIPMSITSGVGLVSQKEKFGRIIAGDSYKKYLILKPNDFAYNKSATKEYPEGFLTIYSGSELAAVPNSIFTCFRVKGESPDPKFLNYLFWGNLHGRWLRKFIQVGARAHGSLSVDDNDLMALPIPLPAGKRSVAEQQRIADCLSSLDALIAAQREKIGALKAHKKGLMQQLFPREGEAVPRLRFPEFRDAGEWNVRAIRDIADVSSGGTPNRSEAEYWNGDIPWVSTSLIGFGPIEFANEYITREGLDNSSAKLVPKGTVLMAMYGQGKTRGKVAVLGIDAAINQACAAISVKDAVLSEFVFQNLASRYDEIRKISNAGGQENLSGALIKNISFKFPSIDSGEQQTIVESLTSLDNLITAHTEKLEALKSHKKGLMQQLFPVVECVA